MGRRETSDVIGKEFEHEFDTNTTHEERNMKKNERAVHLTANEFLASGRNGMNQQVASARWQFMLALQRNVPEFFERLRDEVFPAFTLMPKPGYWRTGLSFCMWQARSDLDGQLTPILMKWARRFNMEGETWILEGALQTLSTWNKFPRCRESLEILGFRKPVCVQGLVREDEHAFHFEDEGWDPTLIRFPGWRVTARKRFEAAIKQHGQQMRALAKDRGGVPAVVRASREHFDWLTLYQCGDATLESIAKDAVYGDKTTISKGMHQAARLARIRIREKSRKLKSQQGHAFSTDLVAGFVHSVSGKVARIRNTE